jgi:cell division septum initiation protein DivIVA
VVVELRRLNQENEELRQRLVSADARIAELQRAPQPAAPAAPEPVAAYPAPVPAPAPAPTPAYSGDTGSMDPSNTNNLLQLARRLHEEHVREGVEKRDALIAEGHATAARLVSEAEAKQRQQLTSLDQERAALEHRIEELRTFEREYRQKLRGYIESQLKELDTSNMLTTGSSAPASLPASAPTPPPQPAAAPAGDYVASPVNQPPTGYTGFAGGN